MKKIGLALGGGAARGIAHIGILKALTAHQIPIDVIAGVSCGSLVAGLFAADLSPEYMMAHLRNLRWRDIAGFQLSKKGMASSRPLTQFIRHHIGFKTLASLSMPFATVATDVLTGEPVVLNEPTMDLSVAIQASLSFPGVFSPLKMADRYLMDGGASYMVPVDLVKEMGADVVIAVDVIPRVILTELPTHLIEIADRGLDLVLAHLALKNCQNADIVLRPIEEHITSFDIHKADRMIALGEQIVTQHIDEIRRKIL